LFNPAKIYCKDMKKPIIGITLDWEEAKTYSIHQPWYALRDNYVSVITQFGGVPILLPYDSSNIDCYVEMLDGLVITGGDYDIETSAYGQHGNEGLRITKQNRYLFERALLDKFLQTKKPMLGICAGEQLLAIATGGTLVRDIPTEIPTAIDHEQWNSQISHHLPYHDILIEKDSKFAALFGTGPFKVNSTHHQAVKTVGPGVIVSARAQDGIIEAIELSDHPFAFGLEWHPEFMTSEVDKMIFRKFIEQASERV